MKVIFAISFNHLIMHHVLAENDACPIRDLAYVTVKDDDWLALLFWTRRHIHSSQPTCCFIIFSTMCSWDPFFSSITLLCTGGTGDQVYGETHGEIWRVMFAGLVAVCRLEHLFNTLSGIRVWGGHLKVLSYQCREAKYCKYTLWAATPVLNRQLMEARRKGEELPLQAKPCSIGLSLESF